MKKRIIFYTLFLVSVNAVADYKDDIGYTVLQGQLGVSIPNGAGIDVMHVEAIIGSTEMDNGAWMPDTSLGRFSGKSILDLSSPRSNGISRHATDVGSLFYGNNGMASGIEDIDVYSASGWLADGFLRAGRRGSQASIGISRIANHSWVGSVEDEPDAIDVLKRVDWSVEENEFIQVVGMNNGSSNQPLLGSSYNSIAVGRTDGLHAKGSIAFDSTYGVGRTRPDVVAPMNTTSSAAPVISAAVAMLIEQAHTAAQGASTIISNGDSIYNGERAEVVKAIIMAGADRATENTSASTQIIDYRADPSNQMTNGLDKRYGAGQVNVFNNYHIMEGGEQNSSEDGGGDTVAFMGYDYDGQFGGEDSSNASASYLFEAIDADNMQLTASLVWNIDIEDSRSLGFNSEATLNNLDLFLYDVTSGTDSLLISSVSNIDNTESLWFFLERGHEYKLLVTVADETLFKWDYGLAWKVSAVPVPSAVWLFGTGILGIFGMKRAKKQA